MVVIHYAADAVRVESERTEYDGGKRTSVRTTQDAAVDVTIEMPDGHVNLDAYAYSLVPDNVAERVQYDLTGDEIEVDTRSLDCDISGTPDEWVTAAGTWASERTGTVAEALERFDGWAETGSGPRRALERLSGEVDA